MSSNPNNAIGTNAAYDGRTSVNAFNDIMGLVSRGVLSGWVCVPKSGMTVSIGGTSGVRDVAIAEDNNGNRTSINNISGVAVDVTISAAPASNSRIDLIVAYVDNPPTGTSTDTDNPGACGIIAVSGTVASTPVVPNESAIRTAITADGASGTTAYYVVLASLTITSGTTDIDPGMITAGVGSAVESESYNSSEIDTGARWVDGKTIYKKTVYCNQLPNNATKDFPHGVSNLDTVVKAWGFTKSSADLLQRPLPYVGLDADGSIMIDISPTNVVIHSRSDRSEFSGYVTIYYTKKG